ncbi:hypothetical protein V1511DRAFT_457142 [Dipodascopsis uninucleata]
MRRLSSSGVKITQRSLSISSLNQSSVNSSRNLRHGSICFHRYSLRYTTAHTFQFTNITRRQFLHSNSVVHAESEGREVAGGSKLSEAEKAELKAAGVKEKEVSENEEGVYEEITGAVTLEDLANRVSEIRATVAENVDQLDPSEFENAEIVEIGFRQPRPVQERSWRRELEKISIDVWKSKDAVHDKEVLEKIATLVVANHLGMIEVEWPENPKRTLIELDSETDTDPFVELLERSTIPKLDFDIYEFSIDDISSRFAISKKISQLSGRSIPDLVFTKATKIKDIISYYLLDSKRNQKYGLLKEDPYNPYATKLFIDPKTFEGTNVKIQE